MLDYLTKDPQKIVVIGDTYVDPDTMIVAITKSKIKVDHIVKLFWGEDNKEIFTKRALNIEKNGPEVESYVEGLEEAIKDADIIFNHHSPIPRSIIEKSNNLKAILTCRGGMEHICLDAASERNIPVINVIRNSEPVADFALGLIIALSRNIVFSHEELKKGKWNRNFPNANMTTSLSKLKVGLVGLGNIGVEVALRLKALGVNIIAYDNYISKERLKLYDLQEIEMVPTLDVIFKEADLISLHLRLTDNNYKMINKKYFSLMKPTAFFVNTSRGGLVEQEDLIHVLKEHTIAGAAIDVFDKEPIGLDDGFAELDNVIITPHIAAMTADAVSQSPFMLIKEVDKIITKGIVDRIVNYKDIKVQ